MPWNEQKIYSFRPYPRRSEGTLNPLHAPPVTRGTEGGLSSCLYAIEGGTFTKLYVSFTNLYVSRKK